MSKKPIDLMLDTIEFTPLAYENDWKPSKNMAYATHEGILRIGETALKVYQLNTGQRVIAEESLNEFFGAAGIDPNE